MLKPVVVAVSSHGFGHLGQTVPVVAALNARFPERKVIVLCAYPLDQVRDFFPASVEIRSAPAQATVAMRDALTVDADATRRDFLDWHKALDQHVEQYATLLRALEPALLLSNIDYTPLLAAKHIGLPAVAFCSLNWSDILQDFASDQVFQKLCLDIRGIYAQADAFLRVSPGMAMPGLANLHRVATLAREGRHYDLSRNLGARRLVLLSLGGISQKLDLSTWQLPEDTHLIVPDSAQCLGERMSRLSALGLPYMDVLRSVDVLLTKPGYGSFCEAWKNRTAVLYVRREQWAEETILIDWLHRHCPAEELSREEFASGNLLAPLSRLSRRPAHFVDRETGEFQVANHLTRFLAGRP